MLININIHQVEFVQELEEAKIHLRTAFFKLYVNIYSCANGQLEKKIGPTVAKLFKVKL